MFKNTAGQEWVVFAFEDEGGTNPGNPVAADQANITATVRIDGGSANTVDDANPTVLAGGYYTFGITAAESNGDSIVIIPVSGTSNVTVIGVPGAVYTTADVSGVQTDLDTLTDNRAHPAQGTPGLSVSMAEKIDFLYKFLVLKKNSTATQINVFNADESTVDHKTTISDDGTTYTEGEWITGP